MIHGGACALEGRFEVRALRDITEATGGGLDLRQHSPGVGNHDTRFLQRGRQLGAGSVQVVERRADGGNILIVEQLAHALGQVRTLSDEIWQTAEQDVEIRLDGADDRVVLTRDARHDRLVAAVALQVYIKESGYTLQAERR